MSGPLVSGDWLEARLGDQAIRIVDASWYMPAEARSGEVEFRELHVPGAVFFDIDQIADHTSDLPHMLPSPEAFAHAAGALGLPRSARVVVDEGPGSISAGRAWWMLRINGYPDVAVLDGGMKAWLAEGRRVESGVAAPVPVTVEPRFDPGLVRDLAAVRSALASGEAQLVDARAGVRFRGEAPEPRAGLRGGHMPGSFNVPFGEVLKDGRLKSHDDIAAAFKNAGVDLDRPVVTSCGSGVTASILTFAIEALGKKPGSVYDGSWSEWGARADTPVVKG
jgi:thiosulfate/3-mercaptopyruvate sulfurtransferase